MNTNADVAIIGGGVIGVSVALELARRNAGRVVVLERDYLCAGTTGQSGAVLRQHYSNDFTAALAKESLEVFRNWAEFVGGDCGFVQNGVLVLAGPETEAGTRSNVEMHRSLGIDTELLDPVALREVEPRLNTEGLTCAAWEATAGNADAVATVHSLAAASRGLGVEIVEGVNVTAIVTQGGKVTGLETSAGRISADIVLNAANIWAPALLRPLGIELTLTASRHPMALLRRPDDFGPRHPVILDMHREWYLIARGGMTLSGSLGTHRDDASVDPNSFEKGVTNQEIVRFVGSATARMPGLARSVVHGGWAGIYDESEDAHPILDAAPGVEGLFIAAGFSGHGFKLSPSFGRLLAERIMGGPEAAPALQPFRYSRFAEGLPIRAKYATGVIS